MKISTRGRYALRVMCDLAEHDGEGFVPLKEIAQREAISQKYTEGIMTDLSKAGVVEALHGKGGGFRLKRPASDYSVGEILRVTEGDLAPITCLREGAEPCARLDECRTVSMWKGLYTLINDYFDGIKLSDLLKK